MEQYSIQICGQANCKMLVSSKKHWWMVPKELPTGTKKQTLTCIEGMCINKESADFQVVGEE